jgi:hypothetical protein
MKKYTPFFLWGTLSLLLMACQVPAQPPDAIWTRHYGGGQAEYATCVQQTSDGKFIVAGYTYSYGSGGADFWLVRTDSCGNSLWSRTYGGSADDRCYSAQETSDRGFILAGSSASFGGVSDDFWLVKTDSIGDTLWTQVYGGFMNEACYSAQQTSDGGYIVTGYRELVTSEEIWLIKTDSQGITQWTKNYGGPNDDECRSVRQTADGGYILGATIGHDSAPYDDFWLIKTDSNGDSLWTRTYGTDNSEICYAVRQTSDGGYIMAGNTTVGNRFFLVKTDANGDTLWTGAYGQIGLVLYYCRSVEQMQNGGYIAVGHADPVLSGDDDNYVVMTDADGSLLWNGCIGDFESDRFSSVSVTSDGGYAFAGHSSSPGNQDFLLVKTAYLHATITSITDVGNDQGRQVRIRWLRHPYDHCPVGITISSYSIYRRIDEYRDSGAERILYSSLDWPPGEWDFVEWLPASGEEYYTTVVPTLADSTSQGTYWSVFFIRSHTPDPFIHYDSEPDSGYSVDNLPPDLTRVVAMIQPSPNQILLQWDEVATGGGGHPEQSSIWYRVYGSTDPFFTPNPSNLLTVTQNLEFLHNTGSLDKFFYIIQVSDDH